MPRRPRPAARPPPTNGSSAKNTSVKRQPVSVEAKLAKPIRPIETAKKMAKPIQPIETSSGSSEDSSDAEEDGSDEDDSEESNSEDDQLVDLDAPRVSQWQDDTASDSDTADNTKAGPSQIKSLQQDLSSMPLGALRKAQRTLKVASDSGSNSSDGEGSQSDAPSDDLNEETTKGKKKETVEWSTSRRTDITKRSSKHAPMEITSKRPVTRRRTVVEVKANQARDPRFLPLAGELSSEKFHQQYSFLADSHKNELRTLRENLKRARKLLTSSPKDLQAERAYEVERLEMAVKRAESLVNQDRRQQIDQAALNHVAQEEKAKRKDGKGSWWMKDSDKKDLLVRARYDALAASGGKRAVKKAIDKKQKKIGQKEKKSRPFSASKRPLDGVVDSRPLKRRRV